MTTSDERIIISGNFARIAQIREEWYEDIGDPSSLVERLRACNIKADLFTFWQRLPEVKPKFDYYMEWDNVAALPVHSYKHWWEKQIGPKTRNLVRKAQKKGVEIKSAVFDGAFIEGMTGIFNESPIRQGKPFWHYGKSFETVKDEFSKNLHREELIGAYCNNELIGFIMLAHAGNYAMTTQIISKISHRDKAPNNALIARAVEICARKGIPYLVYAKWAKGTLGDFKHNNGFEKVVLPRYYIPLSMRGKAILKMGLHHGIKGIVPKRLSGVLQDLRLKWYRFSSRTEGMAKKSYS